MLTFRLKAAALILLGFLPISALQAGTPPLVLEASAKDIGGLSVRFTYKDKELSQYEFKGDEGQVFGAVTLPSEPGTSYEITAWDTNGKITNFGTGPVPAANEDGRPRVLPVPASGEANGLEVSLANERIVVTVKQGESSTFNVQADIFDPYGNPVKIDPIEIRWGLTDGRLALKPLPDGPKVVLIPNKGITIERLCVTPPEVYACTINGHCRPFKVCSDPWTTVSAGDSHTCALTKSGLAYCWGSNTDGQLGSTTTSACSTNTSFNSDCSTRPQAVTCPTGSPCRFTQISAGTTMTAAIDTNGDAWWWGRGGVAHHKVSATLLGTQQKFALISAGFGHACAISSSRSEVWCWGTNAYGESGLPARTPMEVSDLSPNRVLVPFAFRAIAVGGEHSCALGSGGTDVVCWGRNDDKQTSGTTFSQSGQFYFQQFGGLTQIQDIDVSSASSCAALGWGNGVRCWGAKSYLNVATLGNPETVTVGFGQVCGLSGQSASCLGSNNWGELGIGPMMGGQSTAVPVKAPPPLYTKISAGEAHTCGLTLDGAIYCWGRNGSGQVGNGSTAYSVPEPTLAVKP